MEALTELSNILNGQEEVKFDELNWVLLWLSILALSEALQFAETSKGFKITRLHIKSSRFAL